MLSEQIFGDDGRLLMRAERFLEVMLNVEDGFQPMNHTDENIQGRDAGDWGGLRQVYAMAAG
jgi:hypothetical protein